MRSILRGKNPYAAGVLADYIGWARRVAEKNNINFDSVMAGDLDADS